MFGTIAGWTVLAALVTTIGATGTRWLILPRASACGEGGVTYLANSLARPAWYGAIGLVVGMVLFFVRQLAEFRDPFAPILEDASLLLGTEWGSVWWRGIAASFAAAMLLWLALRGRRWAWWAATPILLGLTAFPPFTGHAAGAVALRRVALVADSLHVLAASGWVGGLAGVLHLDRRWRRRGENPESLLPGLVAAFSPVAMGCVAALLVTGVFGAWLHLGEVGHLFTTPYGRILTLKLLVVGVVLGLGALNWRRLSPRLGAPEADEALRRAAAVELLMGHAVLFITAVLVRTSPTAM